MAKIGEGHASAMGRLGVRELRELGNPGGNVVQQSEYGLYGTKTPGEVAEARRGDDRENSHDPNHGSSLDDRMQQAQEREAERDDQDKDRDEGRDIER